MEMHLGKTGKMNGASIAIKVLQKYGISRVFTVVGGSSLGLNKAFANNKYFKISYNHHEQAAAIAAEAYARRFNKPACVCVSSGPGATNIITGILCSYMGSTPMIVISGQVRFKTTTLGSGINVRSLGEQEANIVNICTPITKYSDMIQSSNQIVPKIVKAITLSKDRRPGPCLIDFPLDLQLKNVKKFNKNIIPKINLCRPTKQNINKIDTLVKKLLSAEKPIIIAGYGIRVSNSINKFLKVVEYLKIPVVTGMSGVDILKNNHKNYVGKIGITGDRSGNMIVQNSDLIISIGSRLSYKITGFDTKNWGSNAYKAMIDIDPNEIKRKNLNIELPIEMDVGFFLKIFNRKISKINKKKFFLMRTQKWLNNCKIVQKALPVIKDKSINKSHKVNIYYFYEQLSGYLKKGSIVVSTAGMSRIVGAQSLKLEKDSRFIVNLTAAPMGYCLPAIIGVNKNNKELITCVTGDGSLQMNLQELQTIIQEKINVKIFVLNNGGYHSIRQTQKNFFKKDRMIGVGSDSGDLSFPNLKKISYAYGFKYFSCKKNLNLKKVLNKVFKYYNKPLICEIFLSLNQNIEPKVSSALSKYDKIISSSYENMTPFLNQKKFVNLKKKLNDV